MRRDGDEAVERIRTVSQMVRLISLNASVEAAHAGAAGKSFGIIAGEVKALSEQIEASAQNATDTLRVLTDRL
ncbi:MAG: methyl-accepting chemotaxis protein [Pseudomonadota bacterium]